jgi:hypothetical protein
LKITEIPQIPISEAIFPQKKLILTKNGPGYILGDIFSNSSGHSGFIGQTNDKVGQPTLYPISVQLLEKTLKCTANIVENYISFFVMYASRPK